MRMTQFVCAAALGSVLFACGGSQFSQAKVTSVQAAVRAAEEVGAPSTPKAALHLQLAREQTAQATRLSNDGEGEEANLLLDRAKADAELAIQMAQTEQEQQKASAAWLKVKESQAKATVN